VVVDPDTGRECPRAELGPEGQLLNAAEAVGEIVGRRGSAPFEGYYANDEANAERTRNGWCWTGDLGYVDADGTFWFAGRAADWLRVDGENFGAGSVEAVLGRFPGVRSVVVYGVPDPFTGDQVMASFELDDGVAFDPEAFASFVAGHADIGTKWAPRFVRVVDAIPVTATGKVDRKPLRAERWTTTDPVWWRPGRELAYRRLREADVAGLQEEFVRAGRQAVLSS
jgi:fatty-acyl-CoA synthase